MCSSCFPLYSWSRHFLSSLEGRASRFAVIRIRGQTPQNSAALGSEADCTFCSHAISHTSVDAPNRRPKSSPFEPIVDYVRAGPGILELTVPRWLKRAQRENFITWSARKMAGDKMLRTALSNENRFHSTSRWKYFRFKFWTILCPGMKLISLGPCRFSDSKPWECKSMHCYFPLLRLLSNQRKFNELDSEQKQAAPTDQYLREPDASAHLWRAAYASVHARPCSLPRGPRASTHHPIAIAMNSQIFYMPILRDRVQLRYIYI